MKSYIAVCIAGGLMIAALSATASEAKTGETIVLTGKIALDGGKCVLTTDDGVKVTLPESDTVKAATTKYAGQQVKVTGRGKTQKVGNTRRIELQSVNAITAAPAKKPERKAAADEYSEDGPDARGPFDGSDEE